MDEQEIKYKIEMRKDELDMFVKTIVRHGFIDNCTGGPYFNNLFDELMRDGFDKIHKSILPEDELGKIRSKWSPLFITKMTETEALENKLKYYERLVDWAKYSLEKLDDERKEKIIMDTIEQQDMWSEQFNRNSELYDKLKDGGINGNKTRKTKT